MGTLLPSNRFTQGTIESLSGSRVKNMVNAPA